ncbi:hypothetical protein quinque_001195 [Culex quinquefasciatus]
MECISFTFKGNEPTALSVANACLFLALYPRVQQKLYNEIAQIIPDKSCNITQQTLQDLPYLDMVLKETLRLCPTIPNIARETIRTVSIDGRRIPAGTMFLISFYALHRRADLWGDTVTDFDPERFHPDCGYQRHPFGYLPFSGGARNCIGWQYAQISVKIALIRLVREFKLSTGLKRRDLRFKFDLTLKLAFEHLIQLDRRD